VILEGNTPDAAVYREQTEAAWLESSTRIRKMMNRHSAPVLKLAVGGQNKTLSVLNNLKTAKNDVFDSIDTKGFVTPQDVSSLRYYAESIKHLKPSSGRTLRTYPWDPTSSILILPTTDPIPVGEGDEISLQACRKEYEPASFILRSSINLTDVTIGVSDLVSSDGSTIPKEAVDIRLVKCWFQAGSGDLVQRNEATLVPELLVKDNDLVRVDLRPKRMRYGALSTGVPNILILRSRLQSCPKI
jgi:hypothetical protein